MLVSPFGLSASPALHRIRAPFLRSMALFPEETEARAFADARALVDWVGLSVDDWNSFQEQTGKLGDKIRNINLLSAGAVKTAALAARRADGTPLTPVSLAQIGLVWRIARRLGAPSWKGFNDVDPLEETPTVLVPAPLPSSSSGTSVVLSASTRKVKLSQVLDQADDSEIALAEDATVAKWFNNWQVFAQGPPEIEEEPSIEQLSALHLRVATLKKAPWADFAIFMPFSKRIIKANKFKAVIFQPDGTFISKEVPGPKSMEHWLHSWRVFRVACVMLDIVAEVALQKYQKHIEKLSKLFPDCWGLIYVADDKFRAEHLDRTRRKIEGDIARGLAAPPLWNPSSPWSACFIQGCDDSEQFWNEHVRLPALSWLASGRRGAAISHEEELAASTIRDAAPSGTRRGPDDHAQGAGKRSRKSWKGPSPSSSSSAFAPMPAPRDGGKKGGKSKGQSKGKRTTKHKYSVTTDSKPLCFAWNDGRHPCSSPSASCVAGRVHACTNCRSPNHRASDGRC